MSNPQTQSQRPGAAAMPTEDDFERLLQRDAKTEVSYVPYGAQDTIKLTVTNVQNLIAVRTRKGFTCTTKDALKFIAMCRAKRLNPFEGDCFLIGYDSQDGPTFALVTAHQTYLKRAELHAEFDGMQSGIIIKDDEGKLIEVEGDFYEQGQDVVGGWAKVFFKTRKYPMYKRLRTARFNKGFAQWKEDAPGMICKCAEADALRSAFPTMLGGLYMQEERDVKPVELAKPDFSKSTPLFGAKPASAGAMELPPESEPQSASEAPQPDAEEDGDVGPQKAPTQPPAGNGQPNFLKGVRGLCSLAKIKEGELLAHLYSTGATDGSSTTLDELALSNAETLKLVYEQWTAISALVIGARKAGAK